MFQGSVGIFLDKRHDFYNFSSARMHFAFLGTTKTYTCTPQAEYHLINKVGAVPIYVVCPDHMRVVHFIPMAILIQWSLTNVRLQNPQSIKVPYKLVINYEYYMGVSKNRGTPKSSILNGLSIINHPF